MSERADESALVAALRAGEERAFAELVDAYTPGATWKRDRA